MINKKFTKRTGFVTALVLALGLAVSCGKSDPGPAEEAKGAGTSDCLLTMGWDPWEPYHYLTPGGELWGFDVQLARAIAERAGCRIEFSRDSWANLLEKIAAGEIDFISGATATPDRETFAMFSDPYRSEDFALYVRSGQVSAWQGDSLRSLLESGMRIGVTDSYVYGPRVTELQDDSELGQAFVPAAAGDVNVTRLLDGIVDGFIEDIFVATATIRRRGLEDQIVVHPLVLESGGKVRFMFSRASTSEDLVTRFNQALHEIESSGRYKEIEDRYLR